MYMYIKYYILMYTDLIKHLYSDGHITAEEASQITSKKLFEVPAPPTATAPPIDLSSDVASSSATTAASPVTRASTIDKLTAVFNVLRDLTINYSKESTTGPSVSMAGASPSGLTSLPQLPNSHLGVTVADSQPSITVTPNTPVALSVTAFPSSVSKQNGPADSVTTASAVSKPVVMQTPAQKAVTSGVTSGDAAQSDSLTIGDDASQPASSVVSDASSNEDQSYYDDLVYDQTTDPSHDNTANGMY